MTQPAIRLSPQAGKSLVIPPIINWAEFKRRFATTINSMPRIGGYLFCYYPKEIPFATVRVNTIAGLLLEAVVADLKCQWLVSNGYCQNSP